MKNTQFITREGHTFHQHNGQLHSEADAPAVVYADGSQWWYAHGKIHRENAPAIRFANGVEEWWQNGVRHRDGAPAVFFPDSAAIAPEFRGVRQWWTQGKLVREDVPACVARYRHLVTQAHKACFGGTP